MRTVYRALAWLIAVQVVVQAAAIAYALAGFGKWIDAGGVLDKAVTESSVPAFPEEVGFPVHGINGLLVIPVVALLLLVTSFFARVSRGVPLAVAIVALVAVQVLAGVYGRSATGLGLVHGANALLLFGAAVVAARRPAATAAAPQDDAAAGHHSATAPR